MEETAEDDWDRIMAVNVKGVFLGTKCAIPAMRVIVEYAPPRSVLPDPWIA